MGLPESMSRDEQTLSWQAYVEEVRRRPETPFAEQWQRFSELSADRDPAAPPLPAWLPGPERLARANLSALMRELGLPDYAALHSWSVGQRADFWRRTIARLGIVFAHEPAAILDLAAGPLQPRWLPGARLNIVDSCFRPPACTVAVVVGREGSEALDFVSYGELESLVNRVAGGLVAQGFRAGDAIALYMPMTLECVAAYLGVVRAGCAVVSIADSFAASELARRLEIAGAAAVVTVASFSRGGRRIALYDTVRAAGAPRAVVIDEPGGERPRLREGDIRWDDLLADDATFASVAAEPSTITNILFSSGTTGDPKAVPWTHLTPLKCVMDGHFHHDIRPGDVVAWPTNIGWMMGPWLIYAALVNRACLALYEGLPSGRGFAEFVARAGVSVLGVVPSLVRAWREGRACEGVDWSRIRTFSSTGEPSNRRDYLWLMSRSGYRAPVIEYCGGTEIGGGYLTGTVVQPASPATFTTPALGLEVVVLDGRGEPVAENEEGELFLVPPSIGLSQRLLNRDHEAVYHEGCPPGPGGAPLRRHGDQVARLPGGSFRAQGRADDTMNLGGIKVSSLELERVLAHHPAISEAAAVAVQPEGEGAEKLVVFAAAAGAVERASLRRELGALLASELNPLFKVHDLVLVDSLPRTASGKLMRRELRRRYSFRER
jgi:acetyl-CoA synthetase